MGWLHQYNVVGRKLPSETEPEPALVRMKIFATNAVVAKSKYWYYMRKLRKVKRTRGEILGVSEIKERRPNIIRNYGVWLRYKSRSDTINMYKEYRDTSMTGAVEQMYLEMSGRHRARWSTISILRVRVVEAKDCRRQRTLQMHNSKIRFPLPHRRQRSSSAQFKTTFKAKRPETVITSKSQA